MSIKIPLIRLLTAVVVMLIACVFVTWYDMISAATLERGVSLPAMTGEIVRYSKYAYLLPMVVLIAGALLLRQAEARAVAFECIISFAWITALVWILVAVWAWQLPRVILIN